MVNRRIGREDSETREILLDAAEELMRNEGYAAVTSRKLARFAGLKPQLVHYYFRTMDELFETLFKRVTEKYISDIKRISKEENPILSLFNLSCDISNSVIHLEFLALANHRKSMMKVISDFGGELNRIESEIIRDYLKKDDVERIGISPEELSIIIESTARGMAFSENIAIGSGRVGRYGNARGVLTAWLTHIGATIRKLSELPSER